MIQNLKGVKIEGFSQLLFIEGLGSITTVPAGVKQVQLLTVVSLPANNAFFILYGANNHAVYHVWFSLDGAGTYVPPAGTIEVKVNIATGDTAIVVADKITTALLNIENSLLLHLDFDVTGAGSSRTITNRTVGTATAINVTGSPTITNSVTTAGVEGIDGVGVIVHVEGYFKFMREGYNNVWIFVSKYVNQDRIEYISTTNIPITIERIISETEAGTLIY